MIYAIRTGSVGPIKIGKATNPIARMAELQVGSGEPLNLLAAVRWPDEYEAELHRMLKPHWIRGEWFAPDEPVMWVVEKMRDSESAHEVFWRFKPDHYFPWIHYQDTSHAKEYMDELVSRAGCPLSIVSYHGKWPS